MSMPSLVYVLGLSGAVHIVNYYREAVREHGLEGAPRRALAHGFLPCTLGRLHHRAGSAVALSAATFFRSASSVCFRPLA